jgi:hypothetical protein
MNMLQVFYPSLVVDEDVIHIHHHKIISERPQYIIHHPHESCWGICQTKGMTNHSKRPSFDLKAVFHTFVCSIGTDGSQTSDQSY